MLRLIRARIDRDIRSSLGAQRENVSLRLNHTPIGATANQFRRPLRGPK
jgi:hypothetical protein